MDSTNYQELESQVNIIEVMESEGLKLKKVGDSAQCLCPFHQEKTPSFSVKLDGSGVWKCFGCGESGKGAIAFIRKLKKYGFKDACEYLGIKLNGEGKKPVNKSWSVPPLKHSLEEQNKIKFKKAIKENKESLLSLKNEVNLPIVTDIETNSSIYFTNDYQNKNGQDLPVKDVFNMIIKRGEYAYTIKSEYYGGTYQKTKCRLRIVTGVKKKWPNGSGVEPKFKWTYNLRVRNVNKDGITLKTGSDQSYSDHTKVEINTSDIPLYLINNDPYFYYPPELPYIFLTEGEKDSDILYQLLGLAATTFPVRLDIEKSANKLKQLKKDFPILELVIIFTDNDDSGLKQAKERFLACHEAELACVVINPITQKLVVNFDDQDLDKTKLKSDISDYISELIDQGLSKENIREKVINIVERAVNEFKAIKDTESETKQDIQHTNNGEDKLVTGLDRNELKRELAAFYAVDLTDENTKKIISDFAKSHNLDSLEKLRELWSEIWKENLPQYITYHVKLIFESNVPQSEREAKLANLAQETGFSSSDIRKIYDNISRENSEDTETVIETIDEVIKCENTRVSLNEIAPEGIAYPLTKMANFLNLRPEIYLQTVFTVINTLVNPQTRIRLVNGSTYFVPPNIYSGIIAPSAQKKSVVFRQVINNPLLSLQQESRKEHKQKISDYEELKNLWENTDNEKRKEIFPQGKPEKPSNFYRIYYQNNATCEGIKSYLAERQSDGILAFRDELASLFSQLNQYKNGKGSDKEDLLSWYDGDSSIEIRVDKIVRHVDHILFSAIGGIQPAVFEKMVQSNLDDGNGQWARLDFINQPPAPCILPEVDEPQPFDLTDLLSNLYTEIDRQKSNFPRVFPIAEAAYPFFREFHNYCEIISKSPGTLPCLQNVYGKAHGKVGRYALPIHILDYYFNHGTLEGLPAEISADTVTKAIKWVNFLINQVKGVHTTNDISDNLTGIMLKIYKIALRKQDDWLSSREITNSLSTNDRKNHKGEQIKQYLLELEKMGYGSVEKTSRGAIKFKAFSQRKNLNVGEFTNVGTSVDNHNLQSQPAPRNDSTANVGTVDNSNNSLETPLEIKETESTNLTYENLNVGEFTNVGTSVDNHNLQSQPAPRNDSTANVGTVDNSNNSLETPLEIKETESTDLTNENININGIPSEDQVIETLRKIGDYIDNMELAIDYFSGCDAVKLKFLLNQLVDKGICEVNPLNTDFYRLINPKPSH